MTLQILNIPTITSAFPLTSCHGPYQPNPSTEAILISLLGHRRVEKGGEYFRGTNGGNPPLMAALLVHVHMCSVFSLTDAEMYPKAFSSMILTECC